jgi:hypothetical protein
MKTRSYEVQRWDSKSITWVPIAHADTDDEAIREMRKAHREQRKETFRILDKRNGAAKAQEIGYASFGRVTLLD